jgi:hypothetical protein
MRSLLLFGALFAVAAPADGQSKDKPKGQTPVALYALQLAADPGKATKLTVRGLRLDTATEVRIGEPKSSGKVIGKGRKTAISNQLNPEVVGDTEIEIEVTLPKEVPGGAVPVSLVGPGGEGKPFRLLVNDDTPRVKEKEPNDGFKQAMPIAAPVVVEASFNQLQDVDVYRLDGKAGEKYRIEVQARRYGSPAESLLSLYDSAGHVVATGDPAGEDRDPIIRVRLPKDGPYYVSVIEGFDQGGPMFVYRLAVRRDP